MKKTLYILLLLTIGYNFENYAQNSNIDSLVKVFNTTAVSKGKSDILEKITDYYFTNRNLDSIIHYGKEAINLYQKLNNTEYVSRNQLMVAMSYMEKAEVAKCEQYLMPALDFFKDKKDLRRYARAIALEGAVLQHKQQFEPSLIRFKEVVDLYNKEEKAIDGQTVYMAYRGLFGSYTFAQKFDEALKSADQYFDFVQKHYPNEIGSAHFQLGTLYSYTFDSEKAANEFLKAKAFYSKQNNKNAVAAVNLQLAMAYVALKKTDSAVLLANQAKAHFSANNQADNEAMAFYILAGAAKGNKDFDLANTYIDEAIKLSSTKSQIYDYLPGEKKKIELQMLMADSIGIVNNPAKKAQLNTALTAFKELFNIKASKKTGLSSPHELIESHSIMSKAYALLADYESAYENYKLSTTLKDSVFGTNKIRNLASTEADINLEREKDRIKLEEATKLLQLQKEKELADLHFEYEKKQALAKTEAERKRIMLEEALKRQEIEVKYEAEQKAIALKFEQEKAIAKIEQEKKDAIANAELQSAKNVRNLSALGVALATLLLGIATWFYYQKRKDNKRIAIEKNKSDELLLNILPQEIAEELKEKGSSSAQMHNEVSVLFTDFVNFTANSEKVGVQELLNELNECFTAFDQIMEKRGLEKIKTIGDAYLAVSGLPAANPKHAQNAILAAKDIIQFVEQRKKDKSNALEIRIGIHSGPVIAGIVGVKKFAYDIWGDTVNTAARMEQNSTPGKINISANTYTLAKNDFIFASRGLIETKGKGAIEMYFVD